MTVLNRKKAPKFKNIEKINFSMPEKKELANGIPYIEYNLGSQELIKIEFVFEAGSKYQDKPLLAGLTNSMIKEGTKTKNSLEIANAIDYYGAYLETDHNSDFASVSLYTLNKHLNSVLPIFYDLLVNSIFPEEEFTKKNSIRKQKYIINQEKVETLSSKAYSENIFKGTKYANNTSLASFDLITEADCKRFYKERYNLGNATIFVAGKASAEVYSSINTLFGKTKIKTDKIEFKATASTYLPSVQFINKKNAIQSSFRIGKPIININHPNFTKLKVMNTLFGGYFGSRLMTNIREEKGYTYGIGSVLMSKIDFASFIIYTEVGKEFTQATLDEIRKEIVTLQTEKVSEEELTKVKNYMLGRLLENTDGPFDMLERYKTLYYHNLPINYYDQYIADIKSTTTEEITKLAQKYLYDLSIIVAGNEKVI
jgi:zinc protease